MSEDRARAYFTISVIWKDGKQETLDDDYEILSYAEARLESLLITKPDIKSVTIWVVEEHDDGYFKTRISRNYLTKEATVDG